MRLAIRTLILGTLAAVALTGCVFRDVTLQQQKFDALCILSGTVASARETEQPIVVLLVRKQGAGPATLETVSLYDHFVREGSGRWLFYTSPGTYGLAAFVDTNRDLVYGPDEPYLRVAVDDLIECRPGSRIENIALVIPEAGRPRFDGTLDITQVQARTVQDQMNLSIGLVTAVGEVVGLDDARFDEKIAENGLWRPFDFLFDGRPGVYFLEDYDADKVPVLFVHGVNGTPRNFRYLIDSLDRRRFQPWVYYYPSGAGLDAIASHLDQTIGKLQRRYGFEKLMVVAHSMGGLVARSFILEHKEATGRLDIPVFISIATPWDGHDAARLGVDYAPAVVRSWNDMVPDSAFLTHLFYTDTDPPALRTLSALGVSHHLLFAFQRDNQSFGKSDDHIATVASQMRWEAQDDADRLYGFDETHMGVLDSEKTARLINEILAEGAR